MAILIEGMEMPKSCWDCYFQDCGNCLLNSHKAVDKNIVKDRIDEDCPLIEVPEPHGRLIDADALVEDMKRQCEEVFKIDAVSPDDFWIIRDQAYNERLWKTWCESFFEYLKTRETIIPESEEG